MRSWLLLPLLLVAAPPLRPAQPTAPKPGRSSASSAAEASENDPLLRAMQAEVRRTRLLVSYGVAPFFVQIGVDQSESVTLHSSLGASFAPRQ